VAPRSSKTSVLVYQTITEYYNLWNNSHSFGVLQNTRHRVCVCVCVCVLPEMTSSTTAQYFNANLHSHFLTSDVGLPTVTSILGTNAYSYSVYNQETSNNGRKIIITITNLKYNLYTANQNAKTRRQIQRKLIEMPLLYGLTF
jgi:hypothetical protein